MPPARRQRNIVELARDWFAVVLFAVIAVSVFAKVGEDVFAHETTAFDNTMQTWVLAHQQPAITEFFLVVTTLGGIAGMFVLSVIGAEFLWTRDRRHVASSVLIAPVVALGLFSLIKRAYARPRPSGLGGIVSSSYSFPSGHATASAAVCCTLAYVLWREGFVRRAWAIAFAIVVPLLTGFSRVYLNVHWATDVLGGWSAGVLIAVICAVLYDHSRRRRQSAV
ncbi:MAG: phosphatase PAP2 family protein [Gemmatimonadaceae bacterium]